MNDMIRGLGLKGPGWRIGIDLEEYLQRAQQSVADFADGGDER